MSFGTTALSERHESYLWLFIFLLAAANAGHDTERCSGQLLVGKVDDDGRYGAQERRFVAFQQVAYFVVQENFKIGLLKRT